MSKNDQVKISFKVFNQDFNKAMREMRQGTTELNREFKLQMEQMRLSGSETDKLRARVDFLSKQYDQAQDKVKQTEQQLDKAKKVFGENSEEVRKLEGQLVNARIEEQRFANELQVVTKQLKDAEDPLKRYSKQLDDIGSGFQKAGKKMTDFGVGATKYVSAPILGAGAAMIGLTAKTGQVADRILDLKEITGMSTDSIQEWQHVALHAGVGAETMTKAVEGLIKKIPQLEEEGGNATKQMSKLGLSYDDLRKLSPDDQVDALISGLMELDNVQERNVIGSQLFGGAWKDIAPILSMGTEGIAEAKKEAHDLGKVMSDTALNDANDFRIEMDKMKTTVQGAAYQVGADMAPVLRDTLAPLMTDTLIPAFQEFAQGISRVIEWFANLSPETQNMILKLIGIAVAAGPVITVLGKLTGGLGSAFKAGSKIVTNWSTITATAGKMGAFLKVALASPFLPWIIGIGLAVGAAVWLWKNWDTVKEKGAQLRDFLSNVFSNIGNAIMKPIRSASDFVGKQIERIQNFFNKLKFEFPRPKLPTFSLSGGFSIVPPKVPKINIKWNSEGAIFRRPTVLNGVGVGDGYKGMGSGMEAVLPISKLADLIQDVMPMPYAQPAPANTTINFNGSYQFRDEDDINYFMRKAAQIVKGEGK